MKRLILLAVLAISAFATVGSGIDIPIPDCSPEVCIADAGN